MSDDSWDSKGNIQWSEEMKTGIDRVDVQHKTLIGIINRLQTAVDTKVDLTGISLIFGQLASYTKFHFKAEEMVIEQVDKPNLEIHRMAHRTFVDGLRDYEKKFRSGDHTIVKDLLGYLNVWLVDHILNLDKKSMAKKASSLPSYMKSASEEKPVSDWEWVFSELEKKGKK
ncbi:MAG: bacteriohemerythrin [Leptospirales bacterium]